ncbi:MAG: C45 family autoproteolytic acyltransferase/hydrolase [Armatimonadota bacterium]
MKLVEAAGDARTIGQITGEALREEIRQFAALLQLDRRHPQWDAHWPAIRETLQRYVPLALEEMEGTAQGADLPLQTILQINVPSYGTALDALEGCTNIGFSAGPDGPIWGKNNDGGPPGQQSPPVARLVRRNDGIPQLNWTFCGMLATIDGCNAEGLAVGHSSVGSVFGQSDHHVPIRLWAYEGLFRSRTAAEFVRHMCAVPTRGKGYSSLVVDATGAMCSLESPCPLTQVRLPEPGESYLNCSNYYQLPALSEADRRPPEGKANAIARARLLDERFLGNDRRSLADMLKVLRYHGDPGICRHGGDDGSHTEYSMVGICAERKALYLHGYPCEGEFTEVQL